jgi:hypothetical protein
VFDHRPNGQRLKCLTVTDEFTKEGLAIDVGARIRSARVIEVLLQLTGQRPWCADVPALRQRPGVRLACAAELDHRARHSPPR